VSEHLVVYRREWARNLSRSGRRITEHLWYPDCSCGWTTQRGFGTKENADRNFREHHLGYFLRQAVKESEAYREQSTPA
jgi:hypothetical protein